VSRRRQRFWRFQIVVLCGLFFLPVYSTFSRAQEDERVEQGHPIGKISSQGNIIVMELNADALGKANLFDLAGRTLRFLPEGARYRVENEALTWDSDFGSEMKGADVTLRQFAFPFSGQRWNSFHVGKTGSIRFGEPEKDDSPFPRGPGSRLAGSINWRRRQRG